VVLKQKANLLRAEGSKFMYKTDTRIELRIARQAFLKPWHPDQNQADLCCVEN